MLGQLQVGKLRAVVAHLEHIKQGASGVFLPSLQAARACLSVQVGRPRSLEKTMIAHLAAWWNPIVLRVSSHPVGFNEWTHVVKPIGPICLERSGRAWSDVAENNLGRSRRAIENGK